MKKIQIKPSNLLLKRLYQLKNHYYVLGSEKKSLNALLCYISGYVGGFLEAYANDLEKQSEVLWYVAFKAYITDVCAEGTRQYGIKSAILSKGFDDERGFDAYYQLLDDFLTELEQNNVIVQGYVTCALRGDSL